MADDVGARQGSLGFLVTHARTIWLPWARLDAFQDSSLSDMCLETWDGFELELVNLQGWTLAPDLFSSELLVGGGESMFMCLYVQ